MNPPVITQFASPDPNASPLTVTQLVALLNTLVASEITGSYIPYVISNSTPSVDDQDKAWIYLDSGGRPIEQRIFYNGSWRRIYNGMLGEVRGYNGDPSVDFDVNGLGNVGGNYDGWHLCNGQDGTPNFTDRFIVAGHLDDSAGHVGYSGGWQTFVDGTSDLKTGGAPNIQLDASNTYRPARSAVTAQRFTASGNAPDPGGDLLATGGGGTRYTLSGGDADTGNPTPPPITTLPPFIALGWIIFVGYA